jgi:hypothetical protein
MYKFLCPYPVCPRVVFLGSNAHALHVHGFAQALASLLHLPDNIAGATLLALGNGAPDVFSLIAAFSAQPVCP